MVWVTISQTAEIIDCTFQDSYGSTLAHVVLRENNSYLNNCRLCSNGSCYDGSSPTCLGGGVLRVVVTFGRNTSVVTQHIMVEESLQGTVAM